MLDLGSKVLSKDKLCRCPRLGYRVYLNYLVLDIKFKVLSKDKLDVRDGVIGYTWSFFVGSRV